MGYFDDGPTKLRFRPNSSGQLVLAARLPRLRFYIVPAERAAAIVRFERLYDLSFWIAVPIAIDLSDSWLHTLWVMLPFALVWGAGSFINLWYFTRGLEPAPEMPKPSEAEVAEAEHRKARHRRATWQLAGIVIVLLVGTPLFIASVSPPVRRVIAIPAYILFLWWMFRKPKDADIPTGATPAASIRPE